MELCECWRSFVCADGISQFCSATKKCDKCSCNGDKSKCNFYENVRKEAIGTMNTAEMWLTAQEDGNWYKCHDILYNKKYGFINRLNLKPWYDPDNEEEKGLFNIDSFLNNKWEFYKTAKDSPIMTVEEAEAKFNIRIVR